MSQQRIRRWDTPDPVLTHDLVSYKQMQAASPCGTDPNLPPVFKTAGVNPTADEALAKPTDALSGQPALPTVYEGFDSTDGLVDATGFSDRILDAEQQQHEAQQARDTFAELASGTQQAAVSDNSSWFTRDVPLPIDSSLPSECCAPGCDKMTSSAAPSESSTPTTQSSRAGPQSRHPELRPLPPTEEFALDRDDAPGLTRGFGCDDDLVDGPLAPHEYYHQQQAASVYQPTQTTTKRPRVRSDIFSPRPSMAVHHDFPALESPEHISTTPVICIGGDGRGSAPCAGLPALQMLGNAFPPSAYATHGDPLFPVTHHTTDADISLAQASVYCAAPSSQARVGDPLFGIEGAARDLCEVNMVPSHTAATSGYLNPLLEHPDAIPPLCPLSDESPALTPLPLAAALGTTAIGYVPPFEHDEGNIAAGPRAGMILGTATASVTSTAAPDLYHSASTFFSDFNFSHPTNATLQRNLSDDRSPAHIVATEGHGNPLSVDTIHRSDSRGDELIRDTLNTLHIPSRGHGSRVAPRMRVDSFSSTHSGHKSLSEVEWHSSSSVSEGGNSDMPDAAHAV